mmetsp:Transcript_50480/g.81876  ORF Transcript_50480/g.81876 Transcript_50480/m.81876 type:complete len:234 (-) Transcript_50480:980-1681(-)
MTNRCRDVSPPLQVAEQDAQPCHSLRMQSTGGPRTQPAGGSLPSPGLHGVISTRPPTQNKPWPCPYCATERCRIATPLQLAEHTFHSFQAVKRQSLSGWQGVSTSQNLTCLLSPCAGVPQLLAALMMCRLRQVSPPWQLAEHGAQFSQSPHRPSTQTWLHSPRLQGKSSFISCSSQTAPAPFGIWAMPRCLIMVPPPHDFVQPDHEPQSFHLQSRSQSGLPQALFSASAKKQP